jgi:hypothetical protein
LHLTEGSPVVYFHFASMAGSWQRQSHSSSSWHPWQQQSRSSSGCTWSGSSCSGSSWHNRSYDDQSWPDTEWSEVTGPDAAGSGKESPGGKPWPDTQWPGKASPEEKPWPDTPWPGNRRINSEKRLAVNEQHRLRALEWGQDLHEYWTRLSARGKQAINDQRVLDEYKITSHLDPTIYPCMLHAHRKHTVDYSLEFCKPLREIAYWHVRHRPQDGEAVRLSVTMTNQTNPSQVTNCLVVFFSLLQQSFTGQYDLLTQSDQDLILHSMEQTDPIVAAEVKKLRIQQLYERNSLPTTPEPEFQQGLLPWYHDYLEPFRSNSGKEVFDNGTRSSSNGQGEKWTKLPLPCARDSRIGHIWVKGCRANQTLKMLEELNHNKVTLVLRCDSFQILTRTFVTMQKVLSTADNSPPKLLPWPISGTASDKFETDDFNMISVIIDEISNRGNVLLCCETGLTHSAEQACKVLMLFNGCGLERAVGQLLLSRPFVRINRAQLQDFENQLYSMEVLGAPEMALNFCKRSSMLSCFSTHPQLDIEQQNFRDSSA